MSSWWVVRKFLDSLRRRQPRLRHQRDFGGAVTAGPILEQTPYPARYHGHLFYADYSNQWIRSAPVDPVSDVITSDHSVQNESVSPHGHGAPSRACSACSQFSVTA